MTATADLLRPLRSWWNDVRELDQRLALLARPGDHELLHWSGRELHGRLLPVAGRPATTDGGWCACAVVGVDVALRDARTPRR